MALVLTQTGTQLSGKVKLPWGDVAITQGSVDGNHFALTAKESTWFNLTADGTLEGEKLRYTVHENNDKPYDVVAERTTTDPFVIANIATPPPVKDLSPNGLAKTPPMGWNSWNHFAGKIDDKTVREMADAMVTSGMRDAGYIYVNIDDTWEGDRDANGIIHTNNKFPDMKALADYVHSKGLKLGIYSSPGPNTCAGYEGSYAHEEQDAKTYAAWGIDYLKYDWCSAGRLYKDDAMQAVYQKMGRSPALNQAAHRLQPLPVRPPGRVDVGSQSRRQPVAHHRRHQRQLEEHDRHRLRPPVGLAQYAGPGHWNDPDMLEIGNGGMTADEYRTHMSLWAMLAAPLLAGNDVRDMTDDAKSILLNKEVIAVDQDPMGVEGHRVGKIGDIELLRPAAQQRRMALVVVNRADAPSTVKMPWSEMHIPAGTKVRDLWKHEDFNAAADQSFTIPAHGSLMFRMKAPK